MSLCRLYLRCNSLNQHVAALAIITIVLHVVSINLLQDHHALDKREAKSPIREASYDNSKTARLETSSKEEFQEQPIPKYESITENKGSVSAMKNDDLNSDAGNPVELFPDYIENDSTSTRILPKGEPEIDTARTPVSPNNYSDLHSLELPETNGQIYKSHTLKTKHVTALNIPDILLNNNSKTFMHSEGNCSKFPELSDIKVDNKYWQVLKTNHIIYFYSAYYDGRIENPVVRINSMISKDYSWAKNYFCKLWFDSGEKKHLTTRIEAIQPIKLFKTNLHTAIITCSIPSGRFHKVPFAVSIISSRCAKVTNLLRVDNFLKESQTKHNFAVCVKGMDYPFDDISVFMVEWFELLNLLGVHKVYLYELNVHSNVSKVLEYYKKINRIEVEPITLPGNQPNDPLLTHEYLLNDIQLKRAHEKLPYSDCFYKNMNRYKYITNLDVDEVLLPRRHNTWLELVNFINNKFNVSQYSSFNFQRILSLDDMRVPHGYSPEIPEYMKISQNIYRSTKYEKNPKVIFNTDLVIASANHEPTICLGGCEKFHVRTLHAHVLHYRSTCKKGRDEYCSNEYATRDPSVWRYKDMLVDRTNTVLKLLKLIP